MLGKVLDDAICLTLILQETVLAYFPQLNEPEYTIDHIMLGCIFERRERTMSQWRGLLLQANRDFVGFRPPDVN